MTPQEQARAAKRFAQRWQGKGYERGECQQFWIELLTKIYGVDSSFIRFEEHVRLDHSAFIDAYIDATKVMIEQKSITVDLHRKIRQGDGSMLTPFEQARRYIVSLPVSQHPRWVVTCNFKSFLVYDMENPGEQPEEVLLENLEKEYYRLSFLTDIEAVHLHKELETSMEAGQIIGEVYDAILAQYHDEANPSPERMSRSSVSSYRWSGVSAVVNPAGSGTAFRENSVIIPRRMMISITKILMGKKRVGKALLPERYNPEFLQYA